MPWTILGFGKHKSKTIPQVLFADPDWFFWAMEEDVFIKKGALLSEANDIDYKARNIKIPNDEECSLSVDYYIHRPTGKFSHFDIVPTSQPEHVGSSPAFRSHLVNMSIPRQIAPYDKLGCKHLVSSLKACVFGDKSERMTKSKCEKFFDDPDNFT